jgi:hypothetical protein
MPIHDRNELSCWCFVWFRYRNECYAKVVLSFDIETKSYSKVVLSFDIETKCWPRDTLVSISKRNCHPPHLVFCSDNEMVKFVLFGLAHERRLTKRFMHTSSTITRKKKRKFVIFSNEYEKRNDSFTKKQNVDIPNRGFIEISKDRIPLQGFYLCSHVQ